MTEKISAYYSKAASYCSIAERCEQEIIEKMAKWGTPEDEQQAIINKLIEDDFLNERRYATAFARDKFRFNKWGRIKISYALKLKGISSHNIREGLSAIDEYIYRQTIKKLTVAKQKSIKDASPSVVYVKTLKYLISKGFESDIISQILKSTES